MVANGTYSEYGYGWFVRNWKGSQSIGHGGAIYGFRGMEIYLPQQDIIIAALANSDEDSFFCLFENMTDLLTGTSLLSADKDLKVPDVVLESYVGTYVSTDSQYASDSINIYKEGDQLYCACRIDQACTWACLPMCRPVLSAGYKTHAHHY